MKMDNFYRHENYESDNILKPTPSISSIKNIVNLKNNTCFSILIHT